MGFAQDIFNFRDKALLAANASVNKIVEELFTSVVVLSPSPANPGPYAKGLLANQWYTDIHGNFSSSLSMSTSDYGIDSLSRIKAMIAQNLFLGKDNIVSLTNNVDHAYLAEYTGWQPPKWKRTPPYKMVAKSVLMIKGANM